MGGLNVSVIDGFMVTIEVVGEAIIALCFEYFMLGCEAKIAVDDDCFSTIECKGDSEVCADGRFSFSD